MKYMIISDIHGVAGQLEKAWKRYEEEGAGPILALGDLLYHGPRNGVPEGYDPQKTADLLNVYKDRIFGVQGNCDADIDQMLLDFPMMTKFMVLPMDGFRVVMTHGHHPVEDLRLKAGDVLLSGHTHVLRALKTEEGYGAVNPGSISLPKEGNPPTYAVLEGRTFTIKTVEDGTVVKEFTV